ncbi:MAG: type II secretion system F family protein [Planctomycetota bacterium]|nr:type II secretion system F family protein [Planctomycetota bacterium]
MGWFSYKAVDKGGAHVTGTIEAADRKGAVVALADRGQLVMELAEAAGAEGGKKAALDFSRRLTLGVGRVSSKDILAITTQLATALRAGLPLLNGLELIRDQQHKPAMREILERIAKAVRTGESLSEAMGKYPKVFSPLYLSMIRVGETGGLLEATSTQLAAILGRDEKVKASVKNASAYPIFVLCLGLVSVTIVITWILPKILATITGGVAVLPWPTRILLGLSGFIKALFTSFFGWVSIVVIVAGLVYGVRWMRGEGKIKWDAFKLRIPILGSVLRTIAVGRFARTLGALTKGGVTILEALSVVRDTLGNELLGREIDTVAEKVARGESLGGPLGESGYFPPLLVQIVSIGEQTGKLDELLLNAADSFDADADSAISRFMEIFPAILILLLALVIGFIIAATLLPIVVMELGGGTF